MTKSFKDKWIAAKRFANRLSHDRAGNTLVIIAAAIIPLVGLVGSGLDMSRAYMAQSRLQMACDAGALAGRRAMSNGVVDQTVRDEARKFFRFNFPTGENGTTPPYGVAPFVPDVPDTTDSSVRMTASTTVPTTLMAVLNFTSIPISVSCFARQDFVNTDIVLVLDTTGSMLDDVNNNYVGNVAPSKIDGLRKAVLALYDELAPIQTQLQASGLRLRYGIVPYSVTVNTGKLIRAQNASYMVSDWDYQSRVPVYFSNSPTSTTTCYQLYGNATNCFASAAAANSASGTTISNSRCNSYGSNTAFGSFNPNPSGTPIYAGTNGEKKSSYSRESSTYSNNQKCVRKVVTATYGIKNVSTSGYTFEHWNYLKKNYDLSGFLSGNATTTPSETNNSTSTWKGCIEERDTDSTINSGTTSIPSGAHDLLIDEIPSSKETRWRPSWPEVVYLRNSPGDADPTAIAYTGTSLMSSDSNSRACPTEAKRLQSWTRADLVTYVNSLVADGYTYHDIGMIWGGRFISPNGVFGGDNPSTYNNMPVSRFIIYMTDGQLNTLENAYSAYGVEYLDRRVTGGFTTSADQDNRHAQRFALACQAAKAKGVSIWVVAFASALSTELSNCASKPSQASISTDVNALVTKFAEIGKNIGSLRLTQ